MQIVVGFVAVFASLLIFESATASLPYKDCGSKLGNITELDISGCTQMPCPLKRGTNVTVTMKFLAKADITKAYSEVYGYISFVKVPFSLPDDKACDFMKCPIGTGTVATYTMDLKIEEMYPSVEVIVKWELHNNSKDGDMITCFEVEAKIV